MVRNEYAEAVKANVEEILGEGYGVRIDVVDKGNGVKLTGVTIKEGEQNISPTIYIDSFEKNGKTAVEAADEVVSVYKRSGRINVDANDIIALLNDEERLLSVVQPRLMGAGQSDGYIKYPVLDLEMLFYVIVNEGKDGSRATITLKKGCTSVDPKKLFDAALKNMETTCRSMEEILGPIFMADDCNMIVIGNKANNFGAAGMLNTSVLDELAEQFDDDVVILPSSIHEVICVPAEMCEGNPMVWMVRDINATQLAPNEILSNNVYIYRRNTKSVEIKEA